MLNLITLLILLIFRYFDIGNDDEASEYVHHTKFRTVEYNKKTYQKAKTVLTALKVGISVLYVDTDSVILRDPTPYFHSYDGYDLATSQEDNHTQHCSGLYFARATPSTIKLFETLVITEQTPGTASDQTIMRGVMDEMKDLSVTELNPVQFFDGLRYFKTGIWQLELCCSFANDRCCPHYKPVVVHSNYVYALWNKIYRFKEHLMWHLDKDRYIIFLRVSIKIFKSFSDKMFYLVINVYRDQKVMFIL